MSNEGDQFLHLACQVAARPLALLVSYATASDTLHWS